MKITHDWLVNKRACKDGVEYFDNHFPEGGDYQNVLNNLGTTRYLSYIHWLIEAIGPRAAYDLVCDSIKTNHLARAGDLTCNGPLEALDGINIAGNLKVNGPIVCMGRMLVMGDIICEDKLHCSEQIECWGSMIIGTEIHTGYSTYCHRHIEAKNLICEDNLICNGRVHIEEEAKVNNIINAHSFKCPKVTAGRKIVIEASFHCNEVTTPALYVGR
jgi:cytoskeletal protein CcmA (bactofilin family)